ncbi:hypothetical protein OS493_025678 [Desmophyllum pertusum]|uniref:Uncharacterized protein n=1 Tax=Desmophyllum pertusum TaxID=174260 RepID=A0A9W9ZLH1_9CNID|nr:hypothetical protein OS493_025678 [Desmophyllum pertusum]
MYQQFTAISTARDVAAMTASSLPQSLPMVQLPQQSQKPVIVEKYIKMDRDAQTAETTETSQQKAPTTTTFGQSKRSYPVECKTATDLELQEVVRLKSADQSRESLDEKMSSSQDTDESMFGSDVQCTDGQ